jgi:hypothetical protein
MRRQIGRLSDCGKLRSAIGCRQLAHDHRVSRDAYAHGQLKPAARRKLADRRDNAARCADGALGRIFVSMRVTEIGENAVAKKFGQRLV